MRRLIALTAVVLPLIASAGCEDSFSEIHGAGTRLKVDLLPAKDGADITAITGDRLHPINLTVGIPLPYRIVVTAIDTSGNTDSTFNGYVQISAKPGSILTIASDDAQGRNLKLTAGVSPVTTVQLENPYGTTFLLADDLGYQPLDPLNDPRPACADGLDNDGDGKIDYPADEGCASSNDDTETGGTYSQGASTPIYFALPRIADVRGLTCSGTTCSGNGTTPFSRAPSSIAEHVPDHGDRHRIGNEGGYHLKDHGSLDYDFDMVVTRISSSGST